MPIVTSANESSEVSCEQRVTNLNTSIQQKITGKETTYENKKNDQLKKILTDRALQDQKMVATWKKNDSEQEKKISVLKKQVTTAEKKAAITTFETQIKEATEKKRKMVQDAFALSRKNVDDILNTRKTNLENQKNTFKEHIAGIITTAKSDCQKGVAIKTIENSIRNKITTEKNNFKKELANKNATINTEMISATRKVQLQKIQDEFTKSTQTAKETLTTVLKK